MKNETATSLAILPDRSAFLLGTTANLRLFDAAGKVIWRTPLHTLPHMVNTNGKIAVAGLYDGTIRWYRLTDGREILALFPHPDRKRWILWTPSGYYDASPGGEDFIGWHLNNGPDQAADFFPASRLRSTYYRPDVIDRVLKTLDEAVALQQANDESGRKQVAEVSVREKLPPVVTIDLSCRRSGGIRNSRKGELLCAEPRAPHRTEGPRGRPACLRRRRRKIGEGERGHLSPDPLPGLRGLGDRREPPALPANRPRSGSAGRGRLQPKRSFRSSPSFMSWPWGSVSTRTLNCVSVSPPRTPWTSASAWTGQKGRTVQRRGSKGPCRCTGHQREHPGWTGVAPAAGDPKGHRGLVLRRPRHQRPQRGVLLPPGGCRPGAPEANRHLTVGHHLHGDNDRGQGAGLHRRLSFRESDG